MTVFSIVRENWVTSLVDTREHEQERCDKECIHCEECDDEIPNLAESSLRINEIPFELRDAIDDLVLLIGVLVDVIDHHLLEVGLSHLLETGLESQLVGVTSGLVPELPLAFVLLAVRHFVPLHFLPVVVRL